jgi:hypothetical protein
MTLLLLLLLLFKKNNAVPRIKHDNDNKDTVTIADITLFLLFIDINTII